MACHNEKNNDWEEDWDEVEDEECICLVCQTSLPFTKLCKHLEEEHDEDLLGRCKKMNV
jgi:hypothetical protein